MNKILKKTCGVSLLLLGMWLISFFMTFLSPNLVENLSIKERLIYNLYLTMEIGIGFAVMSFILGLLFYGSLLLFND